MHQGEDPAFASIEGLQRAYLSGSLSAESVVQLFLNRIDRFDQRGPKINAITALNAGALAEARQLDRGLVGGGLRGPLHGIPVLVKDQMETAGIETTFGSVAMRGYVPARNATAVERVKAAGAIVLAKTSMPDFAASWFSLSSRSGATRCPWDLERDAGGSSSGSAAGVAAGFGTVALGEDTGGSIRIPAAYNNLVGVRVTTGLISRAGMAPLVATQDTAGPIARTVSDAAIVLDVLVGFDPSDPATGICLDTSRRIGGYREALDSWTLHGARVGLLTEALATADGKQTSPVTQVFAQALRTLEDRGASVLPVSLPGLPEWLRRTSLYLSRSRRDIDMFLAHRPVPLQDVALIVRRGLYEPSLDLLRSIAESDPGPAELQEAEQAQRQLQQRLIAVMEANAVDVLCFPTTPVIAPRPEELRRGAVTTQNFPTNTLIAAQSGLPAVTVPAGFTPGGSALGLELVGKRFSEHQLLGFAADFHRSARLPLAPPSTS